LFSSSTPVLAPSCRGHLYRCGTHISFNSRRALAKFQCWPCLFLSCGPGLHDCFPASRSPPEPREHFGQTLHSFLHGRPQSGDPGHLRGLTPLSVAAADMASATTVSSYDGTCATAEIGTAAVLAAALPALCVRVRVAVATTTAGDHRSPLGRPWALLLGRQGARHSLPTTLVGAHGARRLVVLPDRRVCRSIHPIAVACTVLAALHACRGLRRRVLPEAHKEFRPPSGEAATTTARAARRASRGAHRLARHRATGARQGATAGTGRGPSPAVQRAPLRVGPVRLPARRGSREALRRWKRHGTGAALGQA